MLAVTLAYRNRGLTHQALILSAYLQIKKGKPCLFLKALTGGFKRKWSLLSHALKPTSPCVGRSVLRLQVCQTPQVLSGGEGGEWAARPPCPLRPVAPGTEQNLLFKSLGSYFWLLGIQGGSLAGGPGMGSGRLCGWRCGCFCSRSAAASLLNRFSPLSPKLAGLPSHCMGLSTAGSLCLVWV